MPAFYEFFAGGGMARAGLAQTWECLLANDFSPKKAASYRANWGGDDLLVADVAALSTADLPGEADLAWASSPCQDVSLAGKNKGLGVADATLFTRSGTFWHFWRLIQELGMQQRAPRLVVLENVCGIITSNQGADFAAIITAFAQANYRVGAVVLDAALFVPQSRKRVFMVGVRADVDLPPGLHWLHPVAGWHPVALQQAQARLSPAAQRAWRWWHLPEPPPRTQTFMNIVEAEPTGVQWHTPAETARLLELMSEEHRQKVTQVAQTGRPAVGGIYRRMRLNAHGQKVQRAEVRFDNIAGCLRTGTGGSSKQTLLFVEGERIRSRLLSPREAARLMGLPDTYVLPASYGDAYHLVGDGVAVPVVRHLAQHLLEPLAAAQLVPASSLASVFV